MGQYPATTLETYTWTRDIAVCLALDQLEPTRLRKIIPKNTPYAGTLYSSLDWWSVWFHLVIPLRRRAAGFQKSSARGTDQACCYFTKRNSEILSISITHRPYPQNFSPSAFQNGYERFPKWGSKLWGRSSCEGSNSSSGGPYGYPQSSYFEEYFGFCSETLAAECETLDQVSDALARAGLESSKILLGIDFTKSNEWTGHSSFGKRCLHHIGDVSNPYEQVISIIGKTLAPFDKDNMIPCFGFGDASTCDRDVFSFYPDKRICNGFEEVLGRYRDIVPYLQLSGATSFAPIIEMAMSIVKQSGGQYHVLLIIADGEVGGLQVQKTTEAIVQTSKLPLSIILVGVGDETWDNMKEFCDNIPARDFNNFHFVNFTEIMSKNEETSRKEIEFALAALMKIPSQYSTTKYLNLGCQIGSVPERIPLPPPDIGESSFNSSHVPPCEGDSQPVDSALLAMSQTIEDLFCSICTWNLKEVVFDCGHQTCSEYSDLLADKPCPFCRRPIQSRTLLGSII
ncbi:E3 ubiquitin-protein ligase RGLG3-like [Hevea brasiliensis]|uniref:E3 ubiquitin-protein ligase RGLG3-like n=1 Tax=Hevea brasiliensis TaxID=3981 RepID=UPI0025F99414|nr:E3 ubiquitin-protein ligase RGLG3-like [Hevea brasiliensis]